LMEREFRKYLKGRGLGDQYADAAVGIVKEFEKYLEKSGTSFASANLNVLRDYISLLIKEGRSSLDVWVAIARYCDFARKNDYYVYILSLLGARNVLPDIGERLAAIAGEDVKRKVFEGFELPPLGSPEDEYPMLTKKIIDRMEAELPVETCRNVLTWNYHKVPTEAFKEKKERFEKASSIDEYLADEHRSFLEELAGFMKEERLWYELEITPEVLEFVRSNQEICTGVRRGDRIYVTKIPYAPKQYLKEKNPTLKRYYACYCPLVRTAIRDGKPKISPVFCHCSSGYEKVGFDVIFGKPVDIELLESALKGDKRCRFAIKIPQDKIK